eukprot:2520542-Alexandrium_andersonii.AAC.1
MQRRKLAPRQERGSGPPGHASRNGKRRGRAHGHPAATAAGGTARLRRRDKPRGHPPRQAWGTPRPQRRQPTP